MPVLNLLFTRITLVAGLQTQPVANGVTGRDVQGNDGRRQL